MQPLGLLKWGVVSPGMEEEGQKGYEGGLFSWTVASDIASLKKGRQGIKHPTLPLISVPSFLTAESTGSPVVACLLGQSISWRRVTSRMEGQTKYSPACLPLKLWARTKLFQEALSG